MTPEWDLTLSLSWMHHWFHQWDLLKSLRSQSFVLSSNRLYAWHLSFITIMRTFALSLKEHFPIFTRKILYPLIAVGIRIFVKTQTLPDKNMLVTAMAYTHADLRIDAKNVLSPEAYASSIASHIAHISDGHSMRHISPSYLEFSSTYVILKQY